MRALLRNTLLLAGMTAAVLGLSLSGCAPGQTNDRGANQSLVEIGESSLEEGEALEGQGRTAEANVAFRRALWAFRYHEKLTDEQPFLMDEAVSGVERTARRTR